MDILSHKKVKTRKKHTCYACHRSFPKGSIMYRQVNTYDGIGQVYWDETCDEIMEKHSDYTFDEVEGIFPDGCVINIPSNCFTRKEIIETEWTPELILEKLNQEGQEN